ncbi:MAG: hypothetical protein ACW986_03815 [Promethearchaeota archaeon]|jgi:hypothetical protein
MDDLILKDLQKMLQKILFREEDLTHLKSVIDKVHRGQESPKVLRKLIVDFRVSLIEKIIEFFPFYSQQASEIHLLDSSKQEIEEGGNTNLLDELTERNRILQEVNLRINKFITTLREKVEG